MSPIHLDSPDSPVDPQTVDGEAVHVSNEQGLASPLVGTILGLHGKADVVERHAGNGSRVRVTGNDARTLATTTQVANGNAVNASNGAFRSSLEDFHGNRFTASGPVVVSAPALEDEVGKDDVPNGSTVTNNDTEATIGIPYYASRYRDPANIGKALAPNLHGARRGGKNAVADDVVVARFLAAIHLPGL